MGKMLLSKRVVIILIVIVVVVNGIVFVYRGLGAAQLSEELAGSWYQAKNYSCSMIEFIECGADITNKHYRLEYFRLFHKFNSKSVSKCPAGHLLFILSAIFSMIMPRSFLIRLSFRLFA